jgi:hypothetical protein
MDDWTPFPSRASFELTEILYLKAHLSQNLIDQLLDIWKVTLVPHGDVPPITDHKDLHAKIDAIELGNVQWKSYTAQYQWLRPESGPVPEWMKTDYHLWYRDPRQVIHHILANPEFASGIDHTPHRDFEDEKRQYRDFMSGNWAWDQCVCWSAFTSFITNILRQDIISRDPATHGCMFVPVMLSTDKMTVSVATGQQSYHPVYLSVGNVHNRLRRAHKDAVTNT